MDTVTSNKSLAKGTAGVSLASAIALVMGFLSTAVMAAYFGLSAYTDSFFLAQIVPNLLSRVFASASDSLFVPIFVRHIREKQNPNSRAFWGSLSAYGIVFLLLLTVLGMVSSPLLVITSSKDLLELATTMSRVFFIVFLFYALNEILKSVLNAAGLYVMAAFSDNIRYLGAILSIIIAHNLGVIVVVYGYLAGAVCQTLLLLAVMTRIGISISLSSLKLHEDLSVLLQRAPVVIGGNVISFAVEGVERYIASSLGVGALTLLGYARQLVFATFNLTIKSTSVVILPQLSSIATQGLRSRAEEVVVSGLRLTALLTGVTCFALIAFSRPVCEALFVRGAFSSEAAQSVSILVMLYAPSMIFGGLNQIFLICYYAFGLPREPMVQYLFVFILNSLMGIALSMIWGVWGLAIAFTVVHLIAVFRIQWRFARDFGNLEGDFSPLALGLLGGGIGVVAVGWFGTFLYSAIFPLQTSRFWQSFATLATFGPLSLAVLLVILKVMRVEEVVFLERFVLGIKTWLLTRTRV